MKSLRSVFSVMFAGSSGRVKLGQPVPESNLSSDENSGSPETEAAEMPGWWLFQYSLRNGGSVPSCCDTSYWSSLSCFLSSASDGLVYCDMDLDPPLI